MAAPQRPSRGQAWSLLKWKQLLVKFILAMSMICLLSVIVSAEVETYHHMSTSQGRMQQGILKWESRRALLQNAIQDRQAPQGFPPPQGNALVNNPRNAPPGRPFFDGQNGMPAARLPDNARHLVPPPHP